MRIVRHKPIGDFALALAGRRLPSRQAQIRCVSSIGEDRRSAITAPDGCSFSHVRRFGNGLRSRRRPVVGRAAVPLVEEYRSDRDSTC